MWEHYAQGSWATRWQARNLHVGRQARGEAASPWRDRPSPAAVVLLAIGTLYAVISDGLTLGPRAFLLGLVAVALVPLMSAHLRGSHRLARWFGLGVVCLVTLAVVVSAFLLVSSTLGRGASATALLRDAALLQVINAATFAVWYREIDGGGPASRRTEGHRSVDLLFPQANMSGARAWHPGFGPTDTAFLSRWAKVLMMVQALLSLVILAVLVGRAINALAAA